MKIKLGKNEYSVEVPRLRKWIEIEDIRLKLEIATDNETFLKSYFGLLSVAIDISIEELAELPWLDVSNAYAQVLNNQTPKLDFPMFKIKAKENDFDWTYEGRTWYIWSNMFAKEYGWSLEYIANLDINDAIGLMHEIVSNEYDKREWEWGLSEIAYPYDSNTKKSTYKPLPKPKWMQVSTIVKNAVIKKVKIRKDMLPQGAVFSWRSDTEDAKYRESIEVIRSSE